MKFSLICLFSLLLLASCMEYKTVRYPVTGKSKIKYRMEIPKGYNFEGLSGDHESEIRYWYADSSVIYITDFSNTINYYEYRKQGTYQKRFDAVVDNDTLTLQGIDSLGRLWKDRKLKYITVGYSRVLPADKAKFEKAIFGAARLDHGIN